MKATALPIYEPRLASANPQCMAPDVESVHHGDASTPPWRAYNHEAPLVRREWGPSFEAAEEQTRNQRRGLVEADGAGPTY
jgi:hypothetical protein